MRGYQFFCKCSFFVGLWGVSNAFAVDSERVEFTGLMATSGQHQSLSSGDTGNNNITSGAYTFQPQVSVKPTAADEFAVKFGFAAGNGLNGYSPFGVATWAADLEDDVQNINGRNRDYLLTAWYKHRLLFAESNKLDVYFGIIDGTDFLDENAYSNDEFTQFMNQALVNGPNFFVPSYDSGVALAWRRKAFKIHAVIMEAADSDTGDKFKYYGAELEYHVNTALGEGNYRTTVSNTSKDFSDQDGNVGKRRKGIIFSFDQQLGHVLGTFIRFGWQSDDATIEYENIASGGFDINGSWWNRPGDNIGIGFAHVNGGNLSIEHTLVAEAYYRWVATEILALTLDLQYISENYRAPNDSTLNGFVPGLRLVAEF